MVAKKVLLGLQPEMLEEVKNQAAEEHHTVSSMIRQALREYMSRSKAEKAIWASNAPKKKK